MITLKVEFFELNDVDFFVFWVFSSWLMSLVVIWIFHLEGSFSMKLCKFFTYN